MSEFYKNLLGETIDEYLLRCVAAAGKLALEKCAEERAAEQKERDQLVSDVIVEGLRQSRIEAEEHWLDIEDSFELPAPNPDREAIELSDAMDYMHRRITEDKEE